MVYFILKWTSPPFDSRTMILICNMANKEGLGQTVLSVCPYGN